MNELALFAGAGGGILGGKLLGWRTVCAVEWDAYARDVLVARQNDGCLDPFPIWDDVQTFDGHPWRGIVDVVSGGFPCQDISAAGKGAGIEGERSGMWKQMARIISEVRPRYVLVENSPMLVGRGLAVVLGDLAALGYDAEWGVLGAHHAGAPHKRDRIWLVAYDPQQRRGTGRAGGSHSSNPRKREQPLQTLAVTECAGLEGLRSNPRQSEISESGGDGSQEGYVADADRLNGWAGTGWQDGEEADDASWWATEPDVGRVAHGVAARVDRLRCIGNGQVPAVVKFAWDCLEGGRE